MVCLFVAPDVDNIASKGGLNDMIGDLIKMAANTGEYGEKKPVPVFFVMNRWALGKAILRKVPIASVAVLNYQGSDENFKVISEMLPGLKKAYQDKLSEAMDKVKLNMTITNSFDGNGQTMKCDNDNIICDTTVSDETSSSNLAQYNETNIINERMVTILCRK